MLATSSDWAGFRPSVADLDLEIPPGCYEPGVSCADLLVDEAVARLPQHGAALDLGCGVGPISLALALIRPDAVVVGCDLDERAVGAARRNAARLDAGARFYAGDLYDALPTEMTFDVICSTLPWPTDEPDDPSYRPREAYYDDSMAYARMLYGAPRHLNPGGSLIMLSFVGVEEGLRLANLRPVERIETDHGHTYYIAEAQHE